MKFLTDLVKEFLHTFWKVIAIFAFGYILLWLTLAAIFLAIILS